MQQGRGARVRVVDADQHARVLINMRACCWLAGRRAPPPSRSGRSLVQEERGRARSCSSCSVASCWGGRQQGGGASQPYHCLLPLLQWLVVRSSTVGEIEEAKRGRMRGGGGAYLLRTTTSTVTPHPPTNTS